LGRRKKQQPEVATEIANQPIKNLGGGDKKPQKLDGLGSVHCKHSTVNGSKIKAEKMKKLRKNLRPLY